MAPLLLVLYRLYIAQNTVYTLKYAIAYSMHEQFEQVLEEKICSKKHKEGLEFKVISE